MKMNSHLDTFTSADSGRNAHFPRCEHGFSGRDTDTADPDIRKRRHTVELEQPRPSPVVATVVTNHQSDDETDDSETDDDETDFVRPASVCAARNAPTTVPGTDAATHSVTASRASGSDMDPGSVAAHRHIA